MEDKTDSGKDMKESGSIENTEKDNSVRSGEPSILKPSSNIDIIIEAWFHLRKDPLPAWQRFLFAWLGSATMYATLYDDTTIKAAKYISKKASDIGFMDLQNILNILRNKYTIITFAIIIVPSIIALVISSSETKHRPLGLFLFGLLLTGFVTAFTKLYS